jgi:Alternative complex III, ActD subunit
MRNRFIVATYSDAETLLKGVRMATEENFRIYDVYAPYPVHGLDQAMGMRRTRLPWVTFVVGMLALAFALSFQFYTTVLDWPLNVGGKPDNSTLAFVPICFELTVLLSGLATVAALFVRARLYPGKKELLFAEGVTNDTFALVLRRRETGFDVHRALLLLNESGADRVREKEVEL